jgi:cation transport ATPase
MASAGSLKLCRQRWAIAGDHPHRRCPASRSEKRRCRDARDGPQDGFAQWGCPEVTTSVGQSLGVDNAVGGFLPDQKAKWVSELRGKNRKVAMVGDGINDAPALVEANVGIAMGSGTDVARESADVILIGSDLSKLVETLRIARRCRGIIMQNFVGTLVVDSIGVGMAAFGFLNPLLAAFIHVTSEMAFILNSTRLLLRSSKIGQ